MSQGNVYNELANGVPLSVATSLPQTALRVDTASGPLVLLSYSTASVTEGDAGYALGALHIKMVTTSPLLLINTGTVLSCNHDNVP